MSTKINARSPFFIEAEEPVVSLGPFSCTTANLLGFRVTSDGTIIDPSILKGTILSRSADSFSANTSGSSISRTVNYTILIPAQYTNAANATIVCPQTYSQPSQTPQEDPVQNDHCPTFSGTIANITNLTDDPATSIALNTYFSEGSTATITTYNVIQSGGLGITYSLSGSGVNQTITFATDLTCVQTSITIEARNSEDACVAHSNAFTISAECPTIDLTCTTDDATNDAIALTNGSIEADGTINSPSFSNALRIKRIEDENDVDVTDGYSENSTGSARSVTLTFIFDIPAHYNNSGEIECDKTFTQQPTSAPLEEILCGDERIVYEGFRIATTGDVVVGESKVLIDGVESLFTVNTQGVGSGSTFPTVLSPTARTIGVDIVIPAGYSNTGNTINCTISREQPAAYIVQPDPDPDPEDPVAVSPCVSGAIDGLILRDFYISRIGVINKCGHCGRVEQATETVFGAQSAGSIVCKDGTPFNGGGFYYLSSRREGGTGGDVGTSYTVIQIDRNGYISALEEVNCAEGDCYQFLN